MTRVAIVGVGNQIMRDDGLSAAVTDALREDGIDEREDVTIDHAGTTAFFALEAMDGADRAILVDALQIPGADPGSIHRTAYTDGVPTDEEVEIDMHDFSFSEALTAGDHAYDLPEEIVVIGMVPRDLSAGLSLSDPVARNVDALTDRVRVELERLLEETAPERSVSPNA